MGVLSVAIVVVFGRPMLRGIGFSLLVALCHPAPGFFGWSRPRVSYRLNSR
jgi:hypothetical protein